MWLRAAAQPAHQRVAEVNRPFLCFSFLCPPYKHMRNYALRAYFVSQPRRRQALLIRTSFSEADGERLRQREDRNTDEVCENMKLDYTAPLYNYRVSWVIKQRAAYHCL